MYTLTLSKDERAAFDWVGNRYAAGEIGDLLILECTYPADWDENEDVTFTVPEHIAWQINDLASEENYAFPCFSDSLKGKMMDFCLSIV